MRTKLLFFGRLAEQLGDEREVDVPEGGCTVAELRRHFARDPDLSILAARATALVSIDQQIVEDDIIVLPGQEIAFFSPLSGG